MIWLRLFIAVIALTISSDLSAWAQPQQMQVNSPEGFYDCNGIANGATVRTDCGCGQPASSTYACLKCNDNTSCLGCDGVPFSGKTDQGCGCDNGTRCYGCDDVANSGKTVVCGTCGGTMGECGRCEGCSRCSFNWGCQDPAGPPDCNPAYSDPSQACPGSGSIGHGETITRINHTTFKRGTEYLWSTDLGKELLSCFTQSFQTFTCNDGTLQFSREGL